MTGPDRWRDRLAPPAFGLVALLAVVMVVLLVGSSASSRGAAGAGATGLPAGVTSMPLTRTPASWSTRPVPAGATGKPGGRPTGPAAGARPKPFVQAFPTGTRKPNAPVASPTAKLVLPVSQDGCDHNYGSADVCVPVAFPPGVTDGCAWLREHGFPPLPVVGNDTLGLDPDGDGTAC